MGALEEITQMKNQGIPENEIINSLKEKGFSPKDISDGLSQSKIKKAVSFEENEIAPPTPQNPSTVEENYQPTQNLYSPQSQEYYPQENYSQDAYADYSSGSGTDTMIEIAEQVYSKETQKMQKQIEELNEFKTLIQTKVELFSERLKRIETIIDKLEVSILEKIGSYGSNLQSIKNEMSMMQDSFGKIVNKAVKKNSKKR